MACPQPLEVRWHEASAPFTCPRRHTLHPAVALQPYMIICQFERPDLAMRAVKLQYFTRSQPALLFVGRHVRLDRRDQVLDLQHGIITDAGARALAACPEVAHLQLLDLSDNCLTEEGIAALRARGVPLRAAGQHAPDNDEWMFEADIE